MKKLVITLAAAMIACTVFAQWGSIKQKGRVTKGNIIVWEKDGYVTDSGASSVVLTNVAEFTSMVSSTNTSGGFAVLDATSAMAFNNSGTTNGYVILDGNGQVSVDHIPDIVVVFSGGAR